MKATKILTSALLVLCLGVPPAVAGAFDYPDGTKVSSQSTTVVCITPTSLDEFWAIYDLGAIENLSEYKSCIILDSGIQGVVLGRIGDKYENLMIRNGEVTANVWTKPHMYKTERDWQFYNCMQASESDDEKLGCMELSDSELWMD